MRLAIASDHAGLDLKNQLYEYLLSEGHDVADLGTGSHESVDYPDYAASLSTGIQKGQYELGILVCGTGIGMSMVANRFEGVRAALCNHVTLARLARQHNNANVLALGGRMTGIDLAKEIVKIFLETDFLGGRHSGRVLKVDALSDKTNDCSS